MDRSNNTKLQEYTIRSHKDNVEVEGNETCAADVIEAHLAMSRRKK
jgi:hypothetical protein